MGHDGGRGAGLARDHARAVGYNDREPGGPMKASIAAHAALWVRDPSPRCLAVLVCNPELLHIRCKNAEQMRLLNALCLFVEMAGEAI